MSDEMAYKSSDGKGFEVTVTANGSVNTITVPEGSTLRFAVEAVGAAGNVYRNGHRENNLEDVIRSGDQIVVSHANKSNYA